MVKIRYNDFKTITVQQTSDSNILTLDSFFDVVKSLFEKKYSDEGYIPDFEYMEEYINNITYGDLL